MDLEKRCGNCGRWIQATYRKVGQEPLCLQEEAHCPWFRGKTTNSKPEGFCWIPINSDQLSPAHQSTVTQDLQKSL